MKSNASSSSSGRILIIGIGNPDRGDDAAGLEVAQRLSERAGSLCSVIEHTGDGTGLMEAWRDAEVTIVIDAVHSGAEPGTIYRFEPKFQPLPALTFRYSTHAFSLIEAIDLSRALNHLPGLLIVYGIEGHEFLAGDELSPKVAAAIPTVVDRIMQEVQFLKCPTLLSA